MQPRDASLAAFEAGHADADSERANVEAGMPPHDAAPNSNEAGDAGVDGGGALDEAGVPPRATDVDGGGARDAAPDALDGELTDADGGQADDDAGSASATLDGDYHCQGQQPLGNDCTAPWVDSQFDPGGAWHLAIEGDRLVTTSIGFDQPRIECVGHWSTDAFECPAAWSRAGRQCGHTLHVRVGAARELTFWVNDRATEIARCSK